MGFIDSIARFFRGEKASAPAAKGTTPTSVFALPPRAGSAPLLLGGGGAMSVATVYRCAKLLSESVASLPVMYARKRDGVFVDAGNHRLDYLLNVSPDQGVSAFDFWRAVVLEVLMDGNAYIVPFYSSATLELERLALCRRGTVGHDTVSDTYTVSDLEGGVSGKYGEDEIIHIKGLTAPGSPKHGVSVLTHARLSVDIASTSDSETLNRFANGGTVKGILSNDRSVRGYGAYQDEQLEAAANDFNRGINLSGENIVSLPGQVAFTQLSLSSVDMQFLESRKFTVLEICRFFGVPPTFVYADTASNYKSVMQADVDFLSHSLNPLLCSIEAELRRKLIAPSLAHKYKFIFDRRRLFACDFEGMMNYSGKLLQIGATVNEVRLLCGLPPVAGGDEPLISANLRPVGEAAATEAPAPETENPESETEKPQNDE